MELSGYILFGLFCFLFGHWHGHRAAINIIDLRIARHNLTKTHMDAQKKKGEQR